MPRQDVREEKPRPAKLARRITVREHLRRRVVEHLKNPPEACLCNKYKPVDNLRRSLIRRLDE